MGTRFEADYKRVSPIPAFHRVEDSEQTYETDFFEFSFGAAGMRGGTGGKHQYDFDGERAHEPCRPASTFTGTADLTDGIGTGHVQRDLAASATLNRTYATTHLRSHGSGGTFNGNLTIPADPFYGGGTATRRGRSPAAPGPTPARPEHSRALTGSISGRLVSGFTLTELHRRRHDYHRWHGRPPPSTTPTISAVQDAASNMPNIAQGSIFIVKGSNLSACGYTPFSAAASHRLRAASRSRSRQSRAAPAPTRIWSTSTTKAA